MSLNSGVRKGYPIFFAYLIILAIVELVISALLISNAHLYADRLDRTRYVLFASCWTVFFCSIYMLLFFCNCCSVMRSVLSHGIFLFITWILWTAAAAVTEMLCGGCPYSSGGICAQMRAMQAFAWIMWITVSLGLMLFIIRGTIAVLRGDGIRGPLVPESVRGSPVSESEPVHGPIHV